MGRRAKLFFSRKHYVIFGLKAWRQEIRENLVDDSLGLIPPDIELKMENQIATITDLILKLKPMRNMPPEAFLK